MRIAAGVEYDGSAYCGWQRQAGSLTVQESLEIALSQIADEPVTVVAAGRTDSGVHACGQVVHFQSANDRPIYSWVRGANTLLPDGVAVLWAKPVDQGFHARFAALSRRYCYVILNRPIRPTYLAKRVAWDYRELDVNRMQQAAALLLGRHDFNAYRASGCQAKSSVREVYRLDVVRRGQWVLIEVEADAFLRHMVRNLAGVLMAIGAGEQRPEWAQAVLRSRDRTAGGVTATAAGLYLVAVAYPERYQLPAPATSLPFW